MNRAEALEMEMQLAHVAEHVTELADDAAALDDEDLKVRVAALRAATMFVGDRLVVLRREAVR